MRHFLIVVLVLASTFAFADDKLAKYEHWITGDVLVDKTNGLLFRADKPAQGNPTGNLLLLGATKQTIKILGPLYVQAADKHQRLRLYGVLLPVPSTNDPKRPTVEFITWKLHLPSDPDDLPTKDKIIIGPNDQMPGYKFEERSKPK